MPVVAAPKLPRPRAPGRTKVTPRTFVEPKESYHLVKRVFPCLEMRKMKLICEAARQRKEMKMA